MALIWRIAPRVPTGINNGVVYEPRAVVAIPARAAPWNAAMSNLTGNIVRNLSRLTRVAIQQHRIPKREHAVVLLDRMLVQVPPAIADKRMDHHQEGATRKMKIGQQEIDDAPFMPTANEQVCTTIE
jgi:hypothetical protein